MQEFLKKIIVEAGQISKEYFIRGVSHTFKSFEGDFLTEADTAVSAFLVDAIREQFPSHHIKSEELKDDINPGAEYEWVIDPIDGTRNFATGIPFWGTIIAVLHHGETLHGAVYFPLSDQLFFATRGQGAFLNDLPIHVSKKDAIEYAVGHAVRMTDVRGPYGDHIARYRTALGRMDAESHLRCVNMGAAATLSFVASGALDFGFGNCGLDWDYLAPVLIAQEAGAIVTDSDGNPWRRGRQDFVMANKDIHSKLLSFFESGQSFKEIIV